MLRVLVRSLGLTLLLFAIFGVAAYYGFTQAVAWMGWTSGGFAEAAAAALMAIALGWLLFRTVAMAVLNLFSDEIVAAVEARDYPAAAARATPLSFAAGLRMGIRSALRALGWNLLALPLYVALLITGVGTLAVFLGLNAYLLGRDLADMVEGRHPSIPSFGWGQRFIIGFVSALLFLVPVANLLAPIVSAAMAVHLFHQRREAIIG